MNADDRATYEDYYLPFFRAVLREGFGWTEEATRAWIGDPCWSSGRDECACGLYFHEEPAYYLVMYWTCWGALKALGLGRDGPTISVLMQLIKYFQCAVRHTVGDAKKIECARAAVRSALTQFDFHGDPFIHVPMLRTDTIARDTELLQVGGP